MFLLLTGEFMVQKAQTVNNEWEFTDRVYGAAPLRGAAPFWQRGYAVRRNSVVKGSASKLSLPALAAMID
jgi:hypothetical protein